MPRKGETGRDSRAGRTKAFGLEDEVIDPAAAIERAKKKYKRSKRGKEAQSRAQLKYQKTEGGKAVLKEVQGAYYVRKKRKKGTKAK